MRNSSTSQFDSRHCYDQSSPKRQGRVVLRHNEMNSCNVPYNRNNVNRRVNKTFVFKPNRHEMMSTSSELANVTKKVVDAQIPASHPTQRPRTEYDFTGTAFSAFHPIDTSLLGDFDQSGSMEPFMDAEVLERLLKSTSH